MIKLIFFVEIVFIKMSRKKLNSKSKIKKSKKVSHLFNKIFDDFKKKQKLKKKKRLS